MFVKAAGEILERGMTAITDATFEERNKVSAVFRKLVGHPIKVVASFIAAPFLVVKIALKVKNPVRRGIAVIGLLTALAGSYAAATFLGSLAGAAIVASKIGILVALGFLVGTTLSVYLSVIFSIIVFNAIAFVFLKMSTQEVIDYLYEIST